MQQQQPAGRKFQKNVAASMAALLPLTLSTLPGQPARR